ncbi:AraC family transcriptional regulator [Ulvibacterium marinum]|uniref:AraC family transcriptional regulator n=1 Tax=Ulvibacterium marinum TaxID=2419782 RepID=A0A3B0C733_9FLAO|nr:AraC family transcriptional regulator [Ulvibacterium marinum]RKN80810.1 AraC family transcriptional regulator [Ulvibacterium marinum]
MEFVCEKIFVPNNHSFISRELPLSSNARIHSHKNFELNYISSGVGRRIVGDNISGFEKGDLVLLGPNLPHCWEVLDTENGEEPTCIVTHFSENIIDSDFFKMPELEKVVALLKLSNRGIRFKIEDDTEIREILEEMSESEGLEYYIGLLKIFHNLLKIEDRERLSNPINGSSVFSKNIEKVNKVYEYVFQNIQEGIKLEEASAVLNMAPSSFCRFFKKKTGHTFMEYVKNVRVGIAAKLLAETDKQITQICYESGYNNLANFNHYFKANMGKTPSDYRKNFR